jgi:hypothetical protein
MNSVTFMCFPAGSTLSASFLGAVTFMKLRLVLTLFPGPAENFQPCNSDADPCQHFFPSHLRTEYNIFLLSTRPHSPLKSDWGRKQNCRQLTWNPLAGHFYDDAKVCFGFYVPYIFFGPMCLEIKKILVPIPPFFRQRCDLSILLYVLSKKMLNYKDLVLKLKRI